MSVGGLRRTAVVTAAVGLVAVGTDVEGSSAASPRAAAKATPLSSDIGSVTVAPHSRAAWALGTEDSRSEPEQAYVLRRVGSGWRREHVSVPTGSVVYDIAAGSPKAIWAVGDTAVGDAYQPLILQSTGGGFTKANINHVASGALTAVAASSATNAWATGAFIGSFGGSTNQPKVAHWDGNRWDAVDDGAQHGYGGVAVATTSPTNVWILGTRANSATAARWDGSKFTVTTLPGGHGAAPQEITTTGPKDVWVVGWQKRNGRLLPYTVHWNGHSWKRYAAPAPSHEVQLTSVAAAGKQVYASGIGLKSVSDSTQTPYLMRFAKGKWKVVTTPHHGDDSNLDAIALSTKIGYAGGNYGTTTSRHEPTEQSFVAVLKHAKWKAVAVPK